MVTTQTLVACIICAMLLSTTITLYINRKAQEQMKRRAKEYTLKEGVKLLHDSEIPYLYNGYKFAKFWLDYGPVARAHNQLKKNQNNMMYIGNRAAFVNCLNPNRLNKNYDAPEIVRSSLMFCSIKNKDEVYMNVKITRQKKIA